MNLDKIYLLVPSHLNVIFYHGTKSIRYSTQICANGFGLANIRVNSWAKGSTTVKWSRTDLLVFLTFVTLGMAFDLRAAIYLGQHRYGIVRRVVNWLQSDFAYNKAGLTRERRYSPWQRSLKQRGKP
jgi:hypothetical protein